MKVSLRIVVLAALLAVAVGAYSARDSLLAHLETQPPPSAAVPAVLAGPNAVTGLVAERDEHGQWFVEFDYYYTGAPTMSRLSVGTQPALPDVAPDWNGALPGAPAPRLVRGRHHARLAVPYPGRDGATTQVVVGIRSGAAGTPMVASQTIDQAIEWPNMSTWTIDSELAREPAAMTLKQASALIDKDDPVWLPTARTLLERLIQRDPKFDAAYVELARVPLHANWGPEGWHQAESLLQSAREINPDNADAMILLGSIYSNQHQYAKAQALFVQAQQTNTPNLWLWEHWGELLEMQGRHEAAIAKFRETITRPMTHDSYDRARLHAYAELLGLLQHRRDLDGMEALYQQRIAEFGPGACYSKDYAWFLLEVRGAPQRAADLARRALNQNCNDAAAREVLGVSEYVLWAEGTGPTAADALHEARLYLPIGAHALRTIAYSERSTIALKKLVAAGEDIDQKDNQQVTALAEALRDDDLPAARRLLAAGAHGDVPVTTAGIPLALIPVVDGRLDQIQLLRHFGTDYKKIRFRGATASEVAKQCGNVELAEALADNSVGL